jgi:hypothetical protein
MQSELAGQVPCNDLLSSNTCVALFQKYPGCVTLHAVDSRGTVGLPSRSLCPDQSQPNAT